jgi:di/tricarboxylate transporter
VTPEIALTLAVLGVAVVLFVTEWLRVDAVAILVMVALPWLGLVTPQEAFSGLASNAVVSVIAVVVLGYGVDRTGVMGRVTRPLLRLAGRSESRLVGLTSAAVGGLSGFMQNVGAAALFLPGTLRVSRESGVPASRLLMPMGFAAILGGTLTMVGSSPLILLNDLLRHGGQAAFGLFAVTPIGLALLASGIAYFVLLGHRVLPSRPADAGPGRQQDLIEAWDLPACVFEVTVPAGSPLAGRTREEVRLGSDYRLSLAALAEGGETVFAPWRQTPFAVGQALALLGERDDAERFACDWGVALAAEPAHFAGLRGDLGGFAEVIVAPRSTLIGRTVREVALRKHFQLEPLLLLAGGVAFREDFSDRQLAAGDALVVYAPWDALRVLRTGGDLVVATAVEGERLAESKAWVAVACFAGAIGLALAGAHLSVALMSGALAMVLLGVITLDEAYRAVDWRTVFLLAGLIPLGAAMEGSGAAAYLANGLVTVLQGSPPMGVMLAFASLATLFSLFMSNVAATVLLVPLALGLGEETGTDPRALALLVAVCASNSFLLPTHQVNALLMAPGGYRNSDYLRAGGLMTLLFLLVAVGGVYLLFPSA